MRIRRRRSGLNDHGSRQLLEGFKIFARKLLICTAPAGKDSSGMDIKNRKMLHIVTSTTVRLLNSSYSHQTRTSVGSVPASFRGAQYC